MGKAPRCEGQQGLCRSRACVGVCSRFESRREDVEHILDLQTRPTYLYLIIQKLLKSC